MIKRYGWSVSVLVLLFALTAGAADITGTWTIHGTKPTQSDFALFSQQGSR